MGRFFDLCVRDRPTRAISDTIYRELRYHTLAEYAATRCCAHERLGQRGCDLEGNSSVHSATREADVAPPVHRAAKYGGVRSDSATEATQVSRAAVEETGFVQNLDGSKRTVSTHEKRTISFKSDGSRDRECGETGAIKSSRKSIIRGSMLVVCNIMPRRDSIDSCTPSPVFALTDASDTTR